jgi:phage tail-like protein
VLDPVLATLDALPAHFAVDLAPDHILELFADWLGVELDDSWSETLRREQIARASELARRRGTARGIELALHVAFPGLPIRVKDEGRVAAAARPEELPPPGRERVTVYCYVPLQPEVRADLGRVIAGMMPAHVPYRVKLRTGPGERLT